MIHNTQATDICLNQALGECAIIIPFKDCSEYTVKCLDSIFASTLSDVLPKIYLIDNNSENGDTLEAISKAIEAYPNHISLLSYQHPFNFSAINNFAVNKVTEKYIFFVHICLHNLIRIVCHLILGSVDEAISYPS